jgi:hypothetical protein
MTGEIISGKDFDCSRLMVRIRWHIANYVCNLPDNDQSMKSACVFVLVILSGFGFTSGEEWTNLFNGKDLQGWETWLATPDSSYHVPGLTRDASGNYTKPLGLNNDPLKVFTVERIEGSPAIHISGQGFGALTTLGEYENFHLSIDYKWGEKKWPPRDKQKRDSGILYYCVGEHGAASQAWMRSQECQVQEGDTGDYWSVAGGIADVRAETVVVNDRGYRQFNPNAPLTTVGYGFDGKNWDILRCLKRSMQEKPNNEWNHVDVYAYNGRSVHVVNGTTVMILENSRQLVNGTEIPLTKGRIQLQTEGAEIFYRNVKVRKIKEIPPALLR